MVLRVSQKEAVAIWNFKETNFLGVQLVDFSSMP